MTSHPKEPKLPESLEVVAWLYTHRVSGASFAADWCWHVNDAAREFHAETQLVRLTDAESALKARDAEIERLRGDAERLDYLQRRGATVEILPAGPSWKFQVGGFHGAVSPDIRTAIDQARATGGEKAK